MSRLRQRGGAAALTAACATVVCATAVLAGCGTRAHTAVPPLPAVARPTIAPVTTRSTQPTHSLRVPAALTAPTVGLRDGPTPVPLTLQIPAIGLDVTVLGVGITPKNVMDAPEGGAEDPVWRQAFWYRGSAVPGATSTALFAGHVDDPLGRPGAFAAIDRLHRGDRVMIRDTRTGLRERFAVTAAERYSVAQWTDPAVLARIYGSGPVAGTWPQRSTDGLAHLTLITCAGTFRNAIGTHDVRLAVYATRVA